jgi:ATP-dependent DNA helicase RecQ
MTDARSVLRAVWGYADFRGSQAEIIEHVIGGGDAVVLMPTGGGKSLCYQVPSLVRNGTGVVISPLIALMQDQVDALAALGIKAGYLNSSQNADARRCTIEALCAGQLDLLYLAPERLRHDATLKLLDQVDIALFAIDEAHCVSQWGHDFRPDYLELSVLHRRWPAVPRLALTATATSATRDEIAERLDLRHARHFVSSFDRPNIRYTIVPKDKPRDQLVQLLRAEHKGDAGIVYCLSRSSVERMARYLSDNGIPALPYHAGLDHQTRADHQSRFLREDGLVMTATIAFGMGIDKPDVRFVAHVDMPKSVEGYYQETGRAGRDGLPATAWMAYGLADVVQQRHLIESSGGDAAFRRAALRHLDAMLSLCETVQCRRVQLLGYFGEHADPCANCDTCLSPAATWDGTVEAQMALSAVSRLARQHGQHYGAGHIIDILRGATSAKIRDRGHDRLSVFGVGAQHDQTAWRAIIRQLLAHGLLASQGAYGTLHLTDLSLDVLTGDRPVLLRRDTTTRHRRVRPTTRPSPALDSEESARFERLRRWRAHVAKQRGVPAYVIFHDATLRDIAVVAPRDLAALGEVSGVGAAKLASFGEGVLQALGHHRSPD